MNPLQNNIPVLEQQFVELLSMINYHRSRASHAVNEQQLLTAWSVGAYVSNKLKTEQWGSKVVTQFVEFIIPNSFVQLPTAQIHNADVELLTTEVEIVQLPTAQFVQSE